MVFFRRSAEASSWIPLKKIKNWEQQPRAKLDNLIVTIWKKDNYQKVQIKDSSKTTIKNFGKFYLDLSNESWPYIFEEILSDEVIQVWQIFAKSIFRLKRKVWPSYLHYQKIQ